MKESTKVKLTLQQLEKLLEMAKNQAEFHDMRSSLLVAIDEMPNGEQFLEFEQPCQWPECNSTYYRYSSDR